MAFMGKVVIVTGSEQGIGHCLALAYAKEKASFIIGSNFVIDGGMTVKMIDTE